MTEERHHATMHDYVLGFRRRKFVILGVALVAAIVAGALSLTQPKQYTAQAALSAQPPSQSAGYANLLATTQQLPTETSAQLEQTATQTAVMQRVKSQLKLKESIDDIRSKISLSTDPASNFVLLDGTASTGQDAAALTNAVAHAVVDISNGQVRAQFAQDAAQERKVAKGLLAPFAGKNYNKLSTQKQAEYQTAAQELTTDEQNAARLQTFSQVVTVATLTEPAGLPSGPSGASPVSTIILGAVVGLILGLIVAWFLESLDRRLRRPDETEELLGMTTIGAVPAGSLGKTPGEDSDDGAASLAAFRMLRTNIRFLAKDRSEGPRVVVVTSAISEEGKTTVSIGLALSSAASGRRTLLIEADVHRPVHAARLGLEKGPGLADYLRDGVAPEKVLQLHSFVDPAQSRPHNGDNSSTNGQASVLTCITAGNVASFSGDALGSPAFGEMINEVRQVYDLIVIDSAPLLAVAETAEMISFADAIVFCARLGRTTTEQARAARAALARLPERLTGLVLTDLQPDVGGYYGYGYGYTYSDTPDREAKESAEVS